MRGKVDNTYMDTKSSTQKADSQTFRDFLDNGRVVDTDTAYSDGSRREPHWSPEAEPAKPLAPSPFAQAQSVFDTLETDAAAEQKRADWERSK